MNLSPIPKLADLLDDPSKLEDLPLEMVANLRGELARLDTLLQMRVAMAQIEGRAEHSTGGDRLLDVEAAAQKLGKSKDYIYHHARGYPFTVRDGRSLRFSEQAIEKYIRQRTGR